MDIGLVAALVAPIQDRAANGPHAVIADLAHGLHARGHRVTVYAALGSRLPGVDVVEIPVEAAVAAARILPGQAVAAPNPALRRAFARCFTAVRWRGHDAISQHAFDADAITMSRDLPIVHTLHLPPIVPDVVAAARGTRSRLATVSAFTQAAWGAAGVHEVIHLPNGVPDRGQRRDAVRPVAVIAGRISPEKGTRAAVRAARRAGLRPWVVGDPYDAAYAAAVLAELRDDEYLGALPRAHLSALMAQAAVTLMPVDWDEPFGLVAAEAQMAGCPVVAYRRGALGEVVADGTSGFLVNPGDEELLPGAIAAASRLDRRAVRASAMARLGVARMIAAYEAALAGVQHAARTVA